MTVGANGRYVLLRGLNVWDGSKWMTAAEITMLKNEPAPVPASTESPSADPTSRATP